MNVDKFQLQQAFLTNLRQMKVNELKALHRETFNKLPAQFSAKIPYWCNRLVYERRLFLAFAAKNYHLPRGSEARAKFLSQVYRVLQGNFNDAVEDADVALKKELYKHNVFDRNKIDAMDVKQINRFLSKLGYVFTGEVSTDDKRQMLWEYFNLPSYLLVKKGEAQTLRRLDKEDSKRLEEIILENPRITWKQFYTKYHKELPLIDNSQFKNKKTLLRKKGYDIPRLDAGGRTAEERRKYNARIRAAKSYRKRRAKHLNYHKGYEGKVTIRLSAIISRTEGEDSRSVDEDG